MVIDYLLVLNTLFILGIALVSPGPDFFLVLKNSLRYGQRAGILTGIGIAVGCFVSFSLVVVGVSYLFKYPLIKLVMNYMCSGYLIYIGWSCFKGHANRTLLIDETKVEDRPTREMFISGFLTNILNPKLYSLTTVIMANVENHQPSTATNISIILLQGFMALIWFNIVARIFTHSHIQRAYFAKENFFNKVLGCLFIIIAIMLIVKA